MKEKVDAIISALKERYPDALCALQYKKDYELMIAVRLSAQCTDARVNLVTPALFEAYPTLEAMANAQVSDVETYIQLYDCLGFLMQVEVETVQQIIHNAKKPVMTIKPMAAGRCTPYVGLTFSWNAIRPCDMVTVGAGSALEVEEDVEISLAAIEHRFPNLGARSSPVKQGILGHK